MRVDDVMVLVPHWASAISSKVVKRPDAGCKWNGFLEMRMKNNVVFLSFCMNGAENTPAGRLHHVCPVMDVAGCLRLTTLKQARRCKAAGHQVSN